MLQQGEKNGSGNAMSDTIIEVSGLGKKFRMWEERADNLKTILIKFAQGNLSLRKKRYFHVLNNISFNIHRGEFVGIMGRNGAGKSTLLKLLCGIYQPSEGFIRVHGTIAPLIELGAGFHPELSGYENIFLNASVLGFGKKDIHKVFDAILEFSELKEYIYMPVKNYSSGMVLRLGFSVASHLTAPILLIDEILAVGDVTFQKKCLKRIHELHQSGKTIILITHDTAAIENHCKRCIVIDHQEKIFDGDAREGAAIYKKSLELSSTP